MIRVKVLGADHTHSQVLELSPSAPRTQAVFHQRNDARITILAGHDLDFVNETAQQPRAFSPDDDPIPPGFGRRFDHGPPGAAIRGWI